MKNMVVLLTILLTGTVLANEYCSNQKLLGFEEATFMLGADVLDSDAQVIAHTLWAQLGKPMVQIDSFVTPATHYGLFRVTRTNELVLMTSSSHHVCFYQVPTEEPIRSGHELS